MYIYYIYLTEAISSMTRIKITRIKWLGRNESDEPTRKKWPGTEQAAT